ncbi:VOC family protein [Shewanella cyperi]|uniref:VOC family protein n=1 Tax=Shewanella cyperi TaxID=2814292 RepID=A0A975AJU5_9GAMM|nr:VOC family protein [Shewanella cyperi]QSX28518.1 VOC family protein [Shewanella cyperi]
MLPGLKGLHHVALIVSDYQTSKAFYTQVLGLPVLAEHFRAERHSWKLDLSLPCGARLELFSFPSAPARLSYPEACGLRHLAFEVSDLDKALDHLQSRGVATEAIRVDEVTGRRFCFFADPDGLPLELYQAG